MRREFSKATKEAAYERSNGHCEGCGLPFSDANRPEYDHDLDDWMGGDNSLENCRALGKKCCHKSKTAAAAAPRAKADRLRDKRANLNPKPSRPIGRRGASNVRDISEERGNG